MAENKMVVKVTAKPKVKVKVRRPEPQIEETPNIPTEVVVGTASAEPVTEPATEAFPIESSTPGKKTVVAVKPVSKELASMEPDKPPETAMVAVDLPEAAAPSSKDGGVDFQAVKAKLIEIPAKFKSLDRNTRLVSAVAFALVIAFAIYIPVTSVNRGAKKAVADYFNNQIEDKDAHVLVGDIAYVKSISGKGYYFTVAETDSNYDTTVEYNDGKYFGVLEVDEDYDPSIAEEVGKALEKSNVDMAYLTAVEYGTDSELIHKTAVIDGHDIAKKLGINYTVGPAVEFGTYQVSREIQSMRDYLATTRYYYSYNSYS